MSLVIAMAFIFVWNAFNKNNIGMVHMSIKKKKGVNVSKAQLRVQFPSRGPLPVPLPSLSSQCFPVISLLSYLNKRHKKPIKIAF